MFNVLPYIETKTHLELSTDVAQISVMGLNPVQSQCLSIVCQDKSEITFHFPGEQGETQMGLETS